MQVQLYGKKIWLYNQPVDFRASIDGLVSVISREFKRKPQEAIYLFYNRGRDKVKCLSWHKNGFILFYKRLEKGRFYFIHNDNNQTVEITLEELGWLLAGLEWQKMRDWNELSYDKFS